MFDFSAAKDISVVPCALGGYSTSSSGADDNGHGSAGMVECLWLDGEWLNTTWVPEGGLDEIWGIDDKAHPTVILYLNRFSLNLTSPCTAMVSDQEGSTLRAATSGWNVYHYMNTFTTTKW
jgi:hypothetical protein